MTGRVVFIGGGPGDPELITVKASRILGLADVVIYAGSLVNPELLDYTRKDVVIYNSASMTLPELVEVMVDYVGQGKLVARVHTGDPSIYGAIGEQIRLLRENNIPFEVIPGVSSLFAVAAALEVELTLPMVSQTVIITRPEGRTLKPVKESIKDLSAHEATMCIFLGVQLISEVVEDLKTHYPLDTPVAVVQKASWKDELVLRGTLMDIVGKVESSGIHKTAIIVVGRVLDPGVFEASKLYDEGFLHEYRTTK
ncbi:MAG: precorrin-4 C(11)-methyltransferase [Methanobacterium sp.]|jgi:precorrin-4/cobalt-precorrin-4 C11-methyltransferase